MAFFKKFGGEAFPGNKFIPALKAKFKIENEADGHDDVVPPVHIENEVAPAIDTAPASETKEAEYTFTRAKLREEMARDGSKPMKFVNEYSDDGDVVDIGDQSVRVREIGEEMIGNFAQQYNTLEDAEYGAPQEKTALLHKEKVVILQKMNNLKINNLLLDLKEVSVRDSHKIETSFNDILRSEREELEWALQQATDPRVKAYIATRKLELSKMENELKIQLLEKEIWELHVESSPEKDALQNKVLSIKENSIRPIMQNLVSALRSEKELFSPDIVDEAEKERLSYISGRLIEYALEV